VLQAWISDTRYHNSDQAVLKCIYRVWDSSLTPPEQITTTTFTDATLRNKADLEAGIPGECPGTILAAEQGIYWMTSQTQSGSLAAKDKWLCAHAGCGQGSCWGAMTSDAVRLPLAG
jgi:hypothetical protein